MRPAASPRAERTLRSRAQQVKSGPCGRDHHGEDRSEPPCRRRHEASSLPRAARRHESNHSRVVRGCVRWASRHGHAGGRTRRQRTPVLRLEARAPGSAHLGHRRTSACRDAAPPQRTSTPAKLLLAAAQHQPGPADQVGLGRDLLGVLDPLVVEVGAALGRPCAGPRPCSWPARSSTSRSTMPGTLVARRRSTRRPRAARRARVAGLSPRRSPPPNRAAEAALTRSVSSAPWTSVVTCVGERASGRPAGTASRRLPPRASSISVAGEEREDPQQLARPSRPRR